MSSSCPAYLSDAKTLIDVIEFRRRHNPDKIYFTLYHEEKSVTFAELGRQVDQYAWNFRQRGLKKGDRMVIMLPTCKEFFFAFFGAQRIGVIPAPIFPNSPPPRVAGIVKDSGAAAIFGTTWMFGETIKAAIEDVPGIQVIDVAEMESVEIPEGYDFGDVELDGDHLAFLQYTSGSTGASKGVMLSHKNLLTNVRAIVERVQLSPDDVGVSWLPLYHDMGLIGFVMSTLYCAVRLILLPPDLRNIRTWLEAVTRYKGNFIAAPDFGFRLCNRNIDDTEGLDLSSVRAAYSGAEPIRAATIRAFQQKFNVGNIFVPAYGLAETSVCATAMYINRDIIEDENGFICVGPPIAGTRIEIVDEEGNALPPRKVGEITLLAGSNTRGYWNRPEENEKLFLPNGFLRTGDLGYLDEEGRLFVVGRKKHMIIRGGQNIAPKDLEEAAEQVEGLRYTAAIGVHDERFGGAERVFLFAEVRDETLSREELARKAREITSKIKERVGFRPSKVYLVRPRVIPLTPNGKIQHVTLKQRFIAGHLEEGKDILYPISTTSDRGGAEEV